MEEPQTLTAGPSPAQPLPEPEPPSTLPPRSRPRSWLRQGWDVLTWRDPQPLDRDVRPASALLVVAASYLLAMLVQRAFLDGEPVLLWRGFLQGWAGTVLLLWLCWVVARSAAEPARRAPVVWWMQLALSTLVLSLLLAPLWWGLESAFGPFERWSAAAQWLLWLGPMGWLALAQMRLLWRAAGSRLAQAAILLLLPLAHGLAQLEQQSFWWTSPSESRSEAADGAADAPPRLVLNDSVLDAQSRLLGDALAGLRPPEPERVNVYALTYAPYATEDVFMRESAAVAKTLRERFGAEGRLVELVINPATATTLPWATRANLRRAIEHMARTMDRERDLLFVHLTSHGGRDGQLAVDSWPLETEPMTPTLLRQWLDEAGVRWRVVSVSACYSGSWVAPLASDGSLVMTAADADHTSYGCGRKSPMTFFGQAMYVEALQQTHSFSAAHAQARQLIAAREKEAGKDDGYSNPQISEGSAIAGQLQRLQRELGP